jgi:CRP/FNR family transcriptional regulator, cyclic AMP receptor protein
MSAISTPNSFKKGDVLFRQGDVSDCVLRVRHGEIEILREVGATSVVLGHVRVGEWLGEMGVIENRARSATARAAADGEVEVLSAAQFLDRVSRDPALARELILRLSIRLRTIEDKIAGELASLPQDRVSDDDVGEATALAIADRARMALTAETDLLHTRIGGGPIAIGQLPFIVGRRILDDEAAPRRAPDLVVEDEEPFRLSRQHFMIARSRDQLLVSDLGSTLGTIVNDQPIGHHFMRDAAPLHRGRNRIVAGGWDSPFAFTLSVD